MLRNGLRAVGLGLALVVAGCEVGPTYTAPWAYTPKRFSEATTRPTAVPTTRPTVVLAPPPTPDEQREWWRTFRDPELNSLIDRAVEQNLDLQLAIEKIRQQRAALGIAASPLYPT